MKKIITLLLLVAVLVSCFIPAFADDEIIDTGNVLFNSSLKSLSLDSSYNLYGNFDFPVDYTEWYSDLGGQYGAAASFSGDEYVYVYPFGERYFPTEFVLNDTHLLTHFEFICYQVRGFSYIVYVEYFNRSHEMISVYSSEWKYMTFDESGNVSLDIDFPIRFDDDSYKIAYFKPSIKIISSGERFSGLACSVNMALPLNSQFHDRLYYYDILFDSLTLETFSQTVVSCYYNMLSSGQIAAHLKPYYESSITDFTGYSFDSGSNDDTNSFNLFSNILLNYRTAILAVSSLFWLYIQFPLVSDIVHLSLGFGLIVLIYGIVVSVSSHEQRRSVRKARKEYYEKRSERMNNSKRDS